MGLTSVSTVLQPRRSVSQTGKLLIAKTWLVMCWFSELKSARWESPGDGVMAATGGHSGAPFFEDST